jgi:hypothetical protein
MSKGKPTCTHIDELPCESLTRVAQKLDRQVNLVAKISAVLACHPGDGCVEKAPQLPLVNRLPEYEIGSRINSHTHAGCTVNDGNDDRCLVRATAAYLGEHIRASRDIVAVNHEAIEVPPSCQFDGACSIAAHFELDRHRTERNPEDLQERRVAGQK